MKGQKANTKHAQPKNKNKNEPDDVYLRPNRTIFKQRKIEIERKEL